ncbi:hypothetical protein XENOCAPTIV_021318 [Xenoophorus captivus]|uniref:Uncharacterized protein n=1 Tax=Xenoophorus captivus TaxID=1517983 RepID=A0ABV0R9V6_9TELE
MRPRIARKAASCSQLYYSIRWCMCVGSVILSSWDHGRLKNSYRCYSSGCPILKLTCALAACPCSACFKDLDNVWWSVRGLVDGCSGDHSRRFALRCHQPTRLSRGPIVI